MGCDKIKAWLELYVDAITDDRENQLINEHLQDCTSCRDELRKIKLLRSVMKCIPERSAPLGFSFDFHNRLNAEKAIDSQEHLNNRMPNRINNARSAIKTRIYYNLKFRNKAIE